MLATAIIAGFAGAAVTIKVWWRRFWDKVRRQPAAAAGAPAEAPVAEPSADEAPESASTALAVAPDRDG